MDDKTDTLRWKAKQQALIDAEYIGTLLNSDAIREYMTNEEEVRFIANLPILLASRINLLLED